MARSQFHSNTFDRLVTVQRRSADRDANLGSLDEEWVTFAQSYARIEDAIGIRATDEKLRADVEAYGRPSTVTMRYLPGLTTDMRIVSGTDILQITAVGSAHRNRWSVLACKEWAHE